MNILQSIIDSGVKLTPMMKQFHEIKVNHQEAILLFRMGDFYEAFFEDASLIAKTLNIAQTHRGISCSLFYSLSPYLPPCTRKQKRAFYPCPKR